MSASKLLLRAGCRKGRSPFLVDYSWENAPNGKLREGLKGRAASGFAALKRDPLRRANSACIFRIMR